MVKIIRKAACLALLFIGLSLRAQMSGTYSVPGTFSTIAAAISSLNAVGVSGAVTINIAAGYTETAIAGGYSLNTITGASASNQVIFQKNGSGANPLITAYTGGTATPSDAVQDGVWRLIGADYVTIDGIDIMDPNTTNPATMEFGYGFFKASATNGCQNNTIQNCNITLSRNNNDNGVYPFADGSRGIDIVNALTTAHTTEVTVSAATGANSNNRIYSNTIQNCNYGVAVIGYADSSPYSNSDTGNNIGGNAVANGNTIINYGGGDVNSPAGGILTSAQYSLNIAYNLINNNNGSGVNHQQTLFGIYTDIADEANVAVTNNTVTVNSGETTADLAAIVNNAGDVGSSNVVNISNNLITSCTYTGAAGAYFYGILNTAAAGTVNMNSNTVSGNSNDKMEGVFHIYNYGNAGNLNMNNNTISNNSTNSDNNDYCQYYNMYNDGGITGTININGNTVGLGTFNASSADVELAGIYNDYGTNSTILSISNNTIQSASMAGQLTEESYLIYNSRRVGTANINGNTFDNVSVGTNSDFYLIYNSNSTRNYNIQNNTIATGFNISGSGGNTLYGYYDNGGPGTGTANISSNNFSNISCGNSAFSGYFLNTSTSQVHTYTSNIISNVTSNDQIVALDFSYGNTGSSVRSNTITNLYGGSDIYGMRIGNNVPSNGLTVSSNVVGTFSTSGNTAEVIGIYHVDGSTTSMFKNKVYDLSGSGTNNFIEGMYAGSDSDGDVVVYNNIIGDLRAPSTSNDIAIVGLEVEYANSVSVYFNSIYLAATSSAGEFGSAALYASDSPTLILRNNILVNNSDAHGNGVATAYMRSSNDLSTYDASSNRNLYYAGLPSLTHPLYYDGTPAVTLANLKTLFAGPDAASVTENPPFISLTSSATNYLAVDPTYGTQIESGASTITAISDDFAGTTRNATTPDIGARESSYTPFSACAGAPTTGSAVASSMTLCPGNVNYIDVASNYSVTGLTYQWQQSTTGAAGSFSSITSATTAAYPSTMALTGVWYQAVVTCSAGGSYTTSPVQVTIGVAVPATAETATIACQSQTVTLSLNGLTGSGYSYQWQHGSALAGPYTNISGETNTTADVTGSVSTAWYQAVISCSAVPAASVVSIPVSLASVAGPTYTTVPFLENFDNTWEDRCDIRNVPNAAYWSSSPTTGNNSWRRQDDGSSANWNSATTGANTPLAGAGCANFHSYYANHTSGSMSVYLDMTAAAPNYSVSFYYDNESGSDSLEVFLSTNGGSSATKVGVFFTQSGWDKKIIDLGPVNSSSCILTFSATSDYGADDIGIDSLEVKTCPGITAASTATAVCAGFSSSLSVTGDARAYYWNGASSSATSAVVTPSATSVYTVVGSNGLCAVSKTLSVIFNPTPTLNLVAPTGICTGLTASLTASGSPATYSWNTGATTASITDTPTLNTSYTVTATDVLGCQTTSVQLVNVGTTLSVSIAGPPAICYGQTANFTASGAYTYVWSSSETTSTIAPSPTVNTTYTVTGTAGPSCSNTAVTTLTVNPNPTVNISGTFTICSGQTATLTANGAGTYTWNTASNNTNIAVSPAVGTTNYSVTGTNVFGCSSSGTTAVLTNALPTLSVALSSTAVCVNSSATFTASGASTYTWSGGATTFTTVVTPTATTVYTVTGTDLNGCVSNKTVSLHGNALPNVSISPSTPTICSTSTLNLTASGASTYSWSNGPSTNSYVVNPATNTTYTVTGTSNQGCVTTKTVAVTTNTLPVVSAVSGTSTVCSTSPVSFTASGATTYTWSDNFATVGSSVTVFPVSNTTYTVTGTNPAGCNSTATVAVSTLPLPSISVLPAISTVCVNSPASFTASGAVTYTWDNTASITGSTAVLTPTGLTSYMISGTGSNGCTGNGSFIVFTNSLPVVSVAASSSTICSLSAVTFTASGADTYSWSNSQSGSTASATPASSSVYTVTGTNTLTGCSNTETVAVTTLSLPVISISPASPTVCAKTQVALSGSGADTYQWSNGSINTSINVTPTVSVSYTLTGTDLFGCVNSQVVNIDVNPLPTITVASPTVCVDDIATFAPSGASTYTLMPGNLTTYTASSSIAGLYSYTITGTDANSCVNKAAVALDVEQCTGLKAYSYSGNVVSVYPNPSTGVFTAQFNYAGDKTVMIVNSVGQLIMEKSTSATSEVFDLSGLSKGVYFVKVSSKEASGNYKIVIE